MGNSAILLLGRLHFFSSHIYYYYLRERIISSPNFGRDLEFLVLGAAWKGLLCVFVIPGRSALLFFMF